MVQSISGFISEWPMILGLLEILEQFVIKGVQVSLPA